MNQGWIKLHRRLLDNPIITKPSYCHLWTVLLLKASHTTSQFIWNGQRCTLQPGQLLTGRKQLSIETGISEGTVERILKFFEKEQQIEQQKTPKFRIITIKKWRFYQEAEQRNEQQMVNKQTASGQQMDTYKNVENDKNDKKYKSKGVNYARHRIYRTDTEYRSAANVPECIEI
jgi:hypothetical protein